ncbi:hypothetical protein [Thermocoleostomius sinensis]|uniref:Uncharacterized protein n=1 Tax=Thermocoleostomius sinensis A174 TaxID=2016057 RepID=A0A9E8ZFX2_9CYAN|nr:hypothetical protein [Thermocoleostomius sinensis]WAL62383.1 hypothetical protein OXH18_10455 [Thermocoleostomius sinensis A174]
MDTVLQRSRELKEALTDFVLDAEGELAVALETFSAEQLTRSQKQNMHQRTLVIDRFITEGNVNQQSPIDLFLQNESGLSESDRQLLLRWKQSFVGLFAITKILGDGFELMNWTTAKSYVVKPNDEKAWQDMARLKEGEIILTQIAPITDTLWIFSSPWTSLGKLGKPKLAVAIGNFKDNYKQHLYSDAPDLLEEAWNSVERYHHDFVEFFGGDEVTMSGYELGKRLTEFQEKITQRNLDEAGIDRSKTLEEIAQEAGISEEELAETAEAMGTDAKTISQVWKQQAKSKMVAPQVELPPNLKKAEHVTAMSHPKWGQLFLPYYRQLQTILEADNWTSIPNAEAIVRRSFDEKDMNAFVWKRLAQQYPKQLETVLRAVFDRPNFKLENDFDALLQEHDKPIEPELPEIASVPVHLHDLFQEAVVEINKNKSKSKTKKKTATGFQR